MEIQSGEMGPLVRKQKMDHCHRPGRGERTRKDRKRMGSNRKSHNECTYPIDIRLLLRKAEMGHALVLDFPQQTVLEEGLDPCVLERLVGHVLVPQPRHVLLVQQARREVLGAECRRDILCTVSVGGSA